MIFAAPWVLLALLTLPLLWWLLRVTPPSPRRELFPAIRLLAGLDPTEEAAARTPWWLLALRVLAAGLVILALARPVLDARGTFAGSGPVLLVMDNGWAAAADWSRRIQAADAILDRAERAGRPVALLATAPDGTGGKPSIGVTMSAADLRARLAALRPQPWPPDRAAAATALGGWHADGAAVVYLGDGVADRDFAAFATSLRATGSLTVVSSDVASTRLLLPPRSEADRLVARIGQVPRPVPSEVAVLAQSGDGRTLARATAALASGAGEGEAAIALPPELRNRLARLVLEGPPSVGSVLLLDEGSRRRPVGLAPGEATSAEAPLTGELYYLERALGPFTEVRTGDPLTLLKRDLSVLILADRPLPPGEERDAIARWVEKGGLLVRFAGPRTANAALDESDPLLPVKLLGGDRQLGGALSWGQPAGVAGFPPTSPFAGLKVLEEVRVSRQVLAVPSADLQNQTWAALADGTPLVTDAARGAGRIVLFHTTANADWSNLALSGLFIDMLRRLVQLSAGVAGAEGTAPLAPAETLDAFGVLSPPPQTATALPADQLAAAAVSPRHPPGLYGPETDRRALNLATALPPIEPSPPIPGAALETLGSAASERALGPWLLSGAIALLALDLGLSLALRGLLRRPAPAAAGAALLVLALATPARSAMLETGRPPALATRLGYVVTGDEGIDGVSKAGLEGLSDYMNRRTSATLAEPDAVTPGRDDLSFYPMLYWPIAPDAQPLAADAAASLNDFMARGGILLIDTKDGGSGGDSTLPQVARGLAIPPLAPLTTDHVLARSFYLLQDFPGRYAGDPVWVQRDQDRANDSVSPVIIGSNDWAAAWAIDAAGQNPYAVIPGGVRQRTLAYRFGTNLVIYALTGNYKGDQVHVPAILERLGQ
ncbi:MAG: DUF4159 domain-containing protein [Acetobacteraceae bacterium]|nr:DUF4159 domain-containing protein [Acetobacteraceae bacterium]